jgi:hypothetical protein
VFDIERGEVFYPAQQLSVVGDTQTEQRVSAHCGHRRRGAPQQQTGTAPMLQQHGHHLVFRVPRSRGLRNRIPVHTKSTGALYNAELLRLRHLAEVLCL